MRRTLTDKISVNKLSNPSPKPCPPRPNPNPNPKPKEVKNPKSNWDWGDTIITWATHPPPLTFNHEGVL